MAIMAQFELMKPEETLLITMSLQESKENFSALRNMLDEYGVAVITGVLSSDEIRHFEELFGQDISKIVGVPPGEEDAVKEATERFCEVPNAVKARHWPVGSLLGEPFIVNHGIPLENHFLR